MGTAHPHDLKGDLVEPPSLLDLLAGKLLLSKCSALVQPGAPSASTLAVVKPPAKDQERMSTTCITTSALMLHPRARRRQHMPKAVAVLDKAILGDKILPSRMPQRALRVIGRSSCQLQAHQKWPFSQPKCCGEVSFHNIVASSLLCSLTNLAKYSRLSLQAKSRHLTSDPCGRSFWRNILMTQELDLLPIFLCVHNALSTGPALPYVNGKWIAVQNLLADLKVCLFG